MANATQPSETADEARTAPAWFRNPDGPGLRYWDGEIWTENYHPGQGEVMGPKELLWALSLGFGVTGGVVGAIAVPVVAFYFPLGFGAGGAALAIAAVSRTGGDTPWYALIAVLGSIAAILLGADAYNEFEDATNALTSFR